MIFEEINSLIAKYLKNGKYVLTIYFLLFIVVAILTLGLIYNSSNGIEKYEHSIFFEW